MTEMGVRSSCDASAVNSACRRRTCSDGADARRPTMVAPENTATARITPKTSSATSRVDWTLAALAMLCPATRMCRPCARASKRKVDVPRPRVTGPDPQVLVGRLGAPVVSGVTTPAGATDHRKRGASSTSVGRPLELALGERQLLMAGILEPFGQAAISGSDEVVRDDQVEHDRGDDVADHDDQGRNGGDPYGVPAVGPGEVHPSTIRYPRRARSRCGPRWRPAWPAPSRRGRRSCWIPRRRPRPPRPGWRSPAA